MSKKYAVAAAACYVTIPEVGSVLLYRDAPVPDAAEDLDRLEAEGLIVEVEEENLGGMPSDIPPDLESPFEPLSPVVRDGVDDVDGDGPIPAKSATKDVWVDYAVSQGADRAEAESLTKAELVDRYGTPAEAPAEPVEPSQPSPSPQPGPGA